ALLTTGLAWLPMQGSAEVKIDNGVDLYTMLHIPSTEGPVTVFGQERYRSMTSSYYRGAHGCLLMFDVTKEESFSNLDAWIENIDLYKTSDPFPCILVGTRCNSPARRIPYERAANYADERQLPYMELDMDHMTDVRRVFETLLDSVTVNMHQLSPIAISIRPDISSREMHVQKKVVCSC
ncbi:hypothetical protein BaRGS_00014718, partial [Batillaria attramentaria]